MNVLGPNYTNTSIAIKNGDRGELDGRTGVIQQVCLPGTSDAIAYSCKGAR
jgi:hypothetical protein